MCTFASLSLARAGRFAGLPMIFSACKAQRVLTNRRGFWNCEDLSFAFTAPLHPANSDRALHARKRARKPQIMPARA